MILLTSYYPEKNKKRSEEIQYCLQKNIENIHISKIILLCEGVLAPINSGKVEEILVNKRPTFSDFISVANIESEDKIKIIANSDIYFTETIQIANYSLKYNEVYCLSRWEYREGNIFIKNNFKGQDSWIFKGGLPSSAGKFHLGIPGCDNLFAGELKKLGRKILNPSLTIVSIHIHESDLRTYNRSLDRLIGDYYYPLPVELNRYGTFSIDSIELKMRKKYLRSKWNNTLEGYESKFFERIFAFLELIYLSKCPRFWAHKIIWW